jgi:Tfp pilus assembly protein PilO
MSRKLKFVLAGLGLVVVVAMAWFLLLSPLRDDIAAVSANIDEQQTKLATALAALAQAETTRAEGKENQARLLELAKMVPISDEIPSLILQIQDLADQSGIEFMSVTQGASIPYSGYQVVPLALEFSGTYFDLSDFIWRAEQLVAEPGRLLAVKQIDLRLLSDAVEGTEAGGTSPVLQVGMTLYAFQTGVDMIAGGAVPLEPAPESTGEEDVTTTESEESGS